MKRTHVLAACLLALAPGAGAIAVAQAAPGGPATSASRAATVQLRSTHLGKILTTSSGLTLYEFTRDSHGRSACATISGCPREWPALQSAGTPTAGPGVKASLLSTITLRSGGKQVTYAGHPLYTYAEDGPGATDYVGVSAFGGHWYALNAAGGAVR